MARGDHVRDDWRYRDDPADGNPAGELDCLRRVLSPDLLSAAETRSRQLGVGADQVLMQWGVIDEQAYVRRLAFHTGVAIETFASIGRDDTPLPDDQIQYAARHGMLPLRINGETIFAIAPRGLAARTLTQFVTRYPYLRDRFRLALTDRLQDFLQYQTRDVLTRGAIDRLNDVYPEMSAAPSTSLTRPRRSLRHIGWTAAAVALLMLPMSFVIGVCGNWLAIWFIGSIGLRLIASFTPPKSPVALDHLRDSELPVYSIIIALYREATSVAPLLRAINALDYPHEKLDLIFAVEPDDLDTRAAIARLGNIPHLRVLVAPPAGPRTKPKALNYALPFARGSFIAVFDAEDRPEPAQFRAALDAFRSQDDRLACVQASLRIDNPDDSLFSRMFAVEYAGQFDLVLPGLARFGLPLPLGGSSNHFRAQALREVGGWDAFNVTEDADLGFRLARFGYRATTIASITFEEAPVRFAPWLRQRSRWMKGWMQTWDVHMRRPSRLWRDVGPAGCLALNLIVGGNLLAALAYPILIAAFLAYLACHAANIDTDWFLDGLLSPLHLAAVTLGYAATIVIGLRALRRHSRLRDGWILLLTPLYWGCLSLATWRALWQLRNDPYRWEKTEHGLARRRNTPITMPMTGQRQQPRRARYR